jgi:glycosyltransferase involved in cell wall biosynthesis
MSRDQASGVTVSVALCTRNGARFIGAQLASILSQTRPPDEIVLSDDASTDDTVARARAAIDEFTTGPHRVSLVVLQNDEALGVAANFEQALRACAGEFVLLSDQDDVWHPERLERSVAVFDGRPDLLLAHGNARLIDQDGTLLRGTLFDVVGIDRRTVGAIHSGSEFPLLLKRNLVTGATTTLRGRLLDAAGSIPSPWIHDEWLAIVAAALGGVDVIDHPLIDYRQHDANEIGATALTLAGKAKRMGEPGSARNARLLARAVVLAERFEKMGVSPESLELVRAKVDHERVRSALVPNRLLRWPRVLGELSTGRYSRFGRGVLDAARDLIQPLTASR